MRKILVSSCLLGDPVRYDGQAKPCLDKRFLQWKEESRMIPICPEVFGGLPTPRAPSQRLGDEIIGSTGENVTREFTLGALEAVRLAEENEVAFAIMKSKSPSCGSKMIYDGSFTGRLIQGEGLAVEYLRKAGYIVFDENELDQAELLLAEE
ncbi:MAG: DUF523 domain-containing protein [Anaerovoracaceae bacterium]